jgi:two-component system response regulator FixJ
MPGEALVHIIDDDAALRESLTFLLSAARMKVATYGSAVTFLECLPTVTSGCIVTDVRMPEMSGIDLLRQLQLRGVVLPVIVMTAHSDVPMAVTAMRLGAVDFLEKPFDHDVFIAAIRAALARQNAIDENRAREAQVRERLSSLSTRERQVLDGLVAGNPNKTIAYDLGISPRTVEVYRANVMTKMNASSLSDLVRMALTAGIYNEG